MEIKELWSRPAVRYSTYAGLGLLAIWGLSKLTKDKPKRRTALGRIGLTVEDVSAREVAKWMLRPYVERGDSLSSITGSYMGYSSPDGTSVSVGGWVGDKRIPKEKIIVEGVPGKKLPKPEIFSALELYNEIMAESFRYKVGDKVILKYASKDQPGGNEGIVLRLSAPMVYVKLLHSRIKTWVHIDQIERIKSNPEHQFSLWEPAERAMVKPVSRRLGAATSKEERCLHYLRTSQWVWDMRCWNRYKDPNEVVQWVNQSTPDNKNDGHAGWCIEELKNKALFYLGWI